MKKDRGVSHLDSARVLHWQRPGLSVLFSSLVGPGWGGDQAKGRWESKGARESRGTGRVRDRGLQRSDCTETEMTQRGHVDAEDA